MSMNKLMNDNNTLCTEPKSDFGCERVRQLVPLLLLGVYFKLQYAFLDVLFEDHILNTV